MDEANAQACKSIPAGDLKAEKFIEVMMRILFLLLTLVLSLSFASAEGIDKQFWGVWQAYSNTAISVTGPIKIDEHHIEIVYGHHVMKAEYEGHEIIKYFGEEINTFS